ncbi:DNA repair protein rad18 [Kwoniella mangroviensis CBS 8886]|uniref:DNA repair protein rad18 n=1 Tax=Kwoniella mangroviensis CBS 8507 TaxID=1296122 RepID=UPI00080D55FE|nr:DNA repair protein rad18 [Kwoniella mangroviensis CBS 8507]OCF67881.1 DNA repair protein rad18 [Kwoniella mangroviensis CBS 8507]OCF78347.1 DNA repair protein rad18 [Kwoniella mangroviensis CBS 8886]
MDMSSHPLLSSMDEPPPFPSNYPQLRRLDRSVICQICKEPFQAPVSIGCGHSFCSSCIRSSLDVMKKCPSCNEPASEGQIRRNRALEEITDAWEESRPTIYDLAKPPPQAQTSKKRPAQEPNSKPSSLSGTKRLKPNSSREASGSRSQSPTKSRRSNDSDAEERQNGEGEEEEDDVQELTENDEAPCPICQATLPISSIPLHIEKGCPPPKGKINGNGARKGNQKADWKKVFSGQAPGGKNKDKEVEMKRIIKPNYALATPAELRSILSDYSLPATGDKATLISRVQEWIILFNSNLDTSHPSSLSALRAKLSDMENSKKRDKERGKDEMINQLGSKDGLQKYAKDKKSEFERLRKEIIERDRKRKEQDEGKGRGRDNAIEVE